MTVCTDVEILELGKFFIYVTDKSIMIMISYIQGVPIYMGIQWRIRYRLSK